MAGRHGWRRAGARPIAWWSIWGADDCQEESGAYLPATGTMAGTIRKVRVGRRSGPPSGPGRRPTGTASSASSWPRAPSGRQLQRPWCCSFRSPGSRLPPNSAGPPHDPRSAGACCGQIGGVRSAGQTVPLRALHLFIYFSIRPALISSPRRLKSSLAGARSGRRAAINRLARARAEEAVAPAAPYRGPACWRAGESRTNAPTFNSNPLGQPSRARSGPSAHYKNITPTSRSTPRRLCSRRADRPTSFGGHLRIVCADELVRGAAS